MNGDRPLVTAGLAFTALVSGKAIAVFETPGLAEPLESIGRVTIELAVTATVTDFDLWVQLYDVGPDGKAWNLSSPGTALQRASYRDSLPRVIGRGGSLRQRVVPGDTVLLRMNRLVTANQFAAGHVIRVVITPQFYPLFSVNPQTGEQEFEDDRVRAGEIRIGHSGGMVSRIILPVVAAGTTNH